MSRGASSFQSLPRSLDLPRLACPNEQRLRQVQTVPANGAQQGEAIARQIALIPPSSMAPVVGIEGQRPRVAGNVQDAPNA
jgi:hypothetical protein